MKTNIQRKEVHLDTETIEVMRERAFFAKKSTKAHMEDVLTAHSQTDLLKCKELLTAICKAKFSDLTCTPTERQACEFLFNVHI